MPTRNERIGKLVQRAVLLFGKVAPVPAPTLIGAVAAAILTKILDIREQRISEVLSIQLSLNHISYIEPDRNSLLQFYKNNPAFPELSSEFQPEIDSTDYHLLSRWYPYLYGALVLKREIPWLLFQKEIETKQYRQLARQYESLTKGYSDIVGDVELRQRIDDFGEELTALLVETYDAAKPELKNKKNQLAFDLMDYIRDAATI